MSRNNHGGSQTEMRGNSHTRALSAGVLTFLMAAGIAAEAAGPKAGGTLVFARPDEPLTLDPFIPADNGSIWAIEQVCDTLIEADATGEGIAPGLAESWEVSDDELTYTFKLRDAKFSNGEPVTVEDVVFSYQTSARPDGTYAFLFEPVESIEAADDMHVRFTLKEPYSPLLPSTSIFAASVVHKATYEADPDKFGNSPVCSGAFKVDEYKRGSHTILSRNEHYWGKTRTGTSFPTSTRSSCTTSRRATHACSDSRTATSTSSGPCLSTRPQRSTPCRASASRFSPSTDWTTSI